MSQPHVIRLRGPWLCWLASCDQATEASAITVDCRDPDGLSQLAAATGQAPVRFGRRFQRPTGLTEATPVQLVVESSTPQLTLSLNSQPLGSAGSGRHAFDVWPALQSTNHLRVEVPAESVHGCRALTDLFSCQLEIG